MLSTEFIFAFPAAMFQATKLNTKFYTPVIRYIPKSNLHSLQNGYLGDSPKLICTVRDLSSETPPHRFSLRVGVQSETATAPRIADIIIPTFKITP